MLERRGISRRGFLRIAVAAGAAGLAGGLGGLLAACRPIGGSSPAPSRQGGSSTGTSQTTATAGLRPTTSPGSSSSTTTRDTGARDIRVGLVSPLTGALAAYSTPAKFLETKWNEALAAGVECGDGQKRSVVILHVDTQSDPNRAAAVTSDLIGKDRVDAVLTAWGADTVLPVADVCEIAGVPLIASFVPWELFFFGRQKAPDPAAAFKWTYAHAPGREEMTASFVDMWNQITTNRTVGLFFPNDEEGSGWVDKTTGLPTAVNDAGYGTVDPGPYSRGVDDFTSLIREYRKNGCEILAGAGSTADFSAFWSQSYRQGYRPKVVTMGDILLFPQSLAALGDTADGITVDYAWGRHWPFKSSLTGETCQQLADDYERRTGSPWTAAIGSYGRMEWLVDAFKRTDDIDSKEKLAAAIASAKLETVLGPIDFGAPVKMGTLRPVENVYLSPIGGGQWVRGATGAREIVQVSNVWSEQCQIQAKVGEMTYTG